MESRFKGYGHIYLDLETHALVKEKAARARMSMIEWLRYIVHNDHAPAPIAPVGIQIAPQPTRVDSDGSEPA